MTGIRLDVGHKRTTLASEEITPEELEEGVSDWSRSTRCCGRSTRSSDPARRVGADRSTEVSSPETLLTSVPLGRRMHGKVR